MSGITIFQRYSKKENQHTNSFMLLLKNFYNFYPDEFYQFVCQSKTVTFSQQVKGEKSTPDGEFIQQALHVIIETKEKDGFNKDQLAAHTNKFVKSELNILITLVPAYSNNGNTMVESLIEDINKSKKLHIKYLYLTYDSAICKIQELINGAQNHSAIFDDILSDFVEYVTDEGLHEPNTLWLKSFPSGMSFAEDLSTGIIYRDGTRPYADIKFIGGYTDKSVKSIGRLIDVVYREFNDSISYEHKIVKDRGKQQEIEYRIEDAVSKSQYGSDSLNRCVHTFYIADSLEPCNFVKISPGGALNVRWFNINDILNMTKEEIEKMKVPEIAKLLSTKTWQ